MVLEGFGYPLLSSTLSWGSPCRGRCMLCGISTLLQAVQNCMTTRLGERF